VKEIKYIINTAKQNVWSRGKRQRSRRHA